jgi:hypothetical protein
VKIFAALAAVAIFCAVDLKAGPPAGENTIYDSDTNHLWNRLNETLFVRTAQDGKKYGLDELDILYWFSTKNLLTEPSHHEALAILDEFNNTHGEKLIRDPLKRALLQRDLWELFDWSAKNSWNSDETHARRELHSRLAVTIRRLALTTNEIASLPDNFAQTENLADLPQGLFQTNGDWLNVGINGYGYSPVAPEHVSNFDGHSAFVVMLHLPDGQQAAISYLAKLRSFAQFEPVWVYQSNKLAWVSTNSPQEILELNPNLPQFPANTEWALVRRMCVIDTDGIIQPTLITESIQMRRYLEGYPQQFFEFQLDRRQNGKLRALGQKEKGFPFVHFRGQGQDPFQTTDAFGRPSNNPKDSTKLQTAVLETCFTCHTGRGIFSVRSYTGLESPQPPQYPKDLTLVDAAREVKTTIYWKQRQFDWGLLQGLWNQEN